MKARQIQRASAALRLRSILEGEFSRRRRANHRYSLRAFARSVNVEHSTLSQLLRGRRAITWKSIRRLGSSMRWNGSAVLEASKHRAKFDSHHIAGRLGITVDDVNLALTDLCLFGLIELKGE